VSIVRSELPPHRRRRPSKSCGGRVLGKPESRAVTHLDSLGSCAIDKTTISLSVCSGLVKRDSCQPISRHASSLRLCSGSHSHRLLASSRGTPASHTRERAGASRAERIYIASARSATRDGRAPGARPLPDPPATSRNGCGRAARAISTSDIIRHGGTHRRRNAGFGEALKTRHPELVTTCAVARARERQ